MDGVLYRVCLKWRQEVEWRWFYEVERRERPEVGWWVRRGPDAGPAWRCWLVGSVAPRGPSRHGSTPRVALLDEKRKPLLSGVFLFLFFSSVLFRLGIGPGPGPGRSDAWVLLGQLPFRTLV